MIPISITIIILILRRVRRTGSCRTTLEQRHSPYAYEKENGTIKGLTGKVLSNYVSFLSHSPDGKTEAQKGEETCSRPQSQRVAEWGPGSFTSHPEALLVTCTRGATQRI